MDLVLDTSFLVARSNREDAHHQDAMDIQGAIEQGHWDRVLLPEYVFLETTTVIMARLDLEAATRVGHRLLEAREIEFVPSSDLFLDTWETFRTQQTPTFSFTDAAVIATARAYGAEEIATFDHGFRDRTELDTTPEA